LSQQNPFHLRFPTTVVPVFPPPRASKTWTLSHLTQPYPNPLFSRVRPDLSLPSLRADASPRCGGWPVFFRLTMNSSFLLLHIQRNFSLKEAWTFCLQSTTSDHCAFLPSGFSHVFTEFAAFAVFPRLDHPPSPESATSSFFDTNLESRFFFHSCGFGGSYPFP